MNSDPLSACPLTRDLGTSGLFMFVPLCYVGKKTGVMVAGGMKHQDDATT